LPKGLINAFGNGIYTGVAQRVGAGQQAMELIKQLQETQQAVQHPLVSAKHIGLNLSAFVLNLNFLRSGSENVQLVMLNPEVISTTAPLVSGLEDDVSIPGLSVSIERPKQIAVKFLDGDFAEQTQEFTDQTARWILHGIDLLSGFTIIDRLNSHRQRSVKGHLKRISERKIETKYKLEYTI
jgi:peptide deformylase